MDILSRVIHSRFETGYICYHPKTVELDLSHLMFGHDVMIFFVGSNSSLHSVTEILDDFAGWPGST